MSSEDSSPLAEGTPRLHLSTSGGSQSSGTDSESDSKPWLLGVAALGANIRTMLTKDTSAVTVGG